MSFERLDLHSLIAAQEELSLYIHIPFCSRRCDYCSFYAIPLSDGDAPPSSDHLHAIVGAYHTSLMDDLHMVTDLYLKPFVSVYIGGGNPGLLTTAQISEIAALVQTHGSPLEMTIEMNPENVSSQGLEALVSAGFTRLSIGVQSLQHDTLRTLGRNTTVEQTERALGLTGLVRGRLQLNLDLICCVPGQTIESAIIDIDTLIERYDPEHLSLYNLTIEEGTPLALRSNGIDSDAQEQDEESQFLMLDALWRYLSSKGYHQYEVSNFYRHTPMRRSLHNLRYWQVKPYLGIGSGAVSTLYDKSISEYRRFEALPSDGRGGNEEPYLMIHQSAGFQYGEEQLTTLDYIKERFIMGLRTQEGVDLAALNECIGFDTISLLQDCVTRHGLQSFVMYEDSHLRLTEQGIMILDTILRYLLISLDTLETVLGTDPVIARDT